VKAAALAVVRQARAGGWVGRAARPCEWGRDLIVAPGRYWMINMRQPDGQGLPVFSPSSQSS